MLNGLDLFSGIGGMSLALREWVRPITYCEIDPYCQGVLLSRMSCGELPKAPIYEDIRSLTGLEFAGNIHIIYGGFPCQDISTMGNGKGLEGERSGMFFQIIRLAKEIKPKFLFLENVSAITRRGGPTIARIIADMGYDCRWCCISAEAIGSPHKRERWFLLAHAHSEPSSKAYTTSKPFTTKETTWLRSSGQDRRKISGSYWKENQCPLFGMDDGLPFEMDRAKALGNAVVPAQCKKAFEILMGINMKKVIIDGKEYWQQEQSDIDKLPPMNISKDILTKYQTEIAAPIIEE